MESRTQGSIPRPRTRKKSEAKAKDSPSKDRFSRGQGQECSRPRPKTKDTGSSDLQKKEIFEKFFQAISKSGIRKKSSRIFPRFLAFSNKILRVKKIVLSSNQGQGNFRGLEASKPRPRTSNCVLEAKDVLEDSISAFYISY